MKTTHENHSLGCAGLAIGTNAGSFKTSNNVHFQIAGRSYFKAATDNLTFTAGHTNLGNNQTCAFFVWIDSAGTVTTTQSAIVPSTSAATGYQKGAWGIPIDATKALVGAIVVSCSAAQTFTVGTTVLGTGNTATYINLADDLGAPITY